MKEKLKIIIPIIISIAVIIAALLLIKFEPSQKAGNISPLSSAQKYLTESNYEQAIIEFKKAIELDPMNTDAYLGLAQAYEKLGDIENAVATLEKGYELTGDERLKAALDVMIGVNEETTAETTTAVTTTAVTTTAETTTVVSMSPEEVVREAVLENYYQLPIPYFYKGEPNSSVYFTCKVIEEDNYGEEYIIKNVYDENSNLKYQLEIHYIDSEHPGEVSSVVLYDIETDEFKQFQKVFDKEVAAACGSDWICVPHQDYSATLIRNFRNIDAENCFFAYEDNHSVVHEQSSDSLIIGACNNDDIVKFDKKQNITSITSGHDSYILSEFTKTKNGKWREKRYEDTIEYQLGLASGYSEKDMNLPSEYVIYQIN